MNPRIRRPVLVAGALVLTAAAFLGGRLTATQRPGPPVDGGYAAGIRAGEQLGVQEGRALQEGAALPAADRRAVQDAFDAGYSAGANDVFSGYDGGWHTDVPYLVTLSHGTGPITYRIASRIEVEDGVRYVRCAGGHQACPEPRP